MALSVWSFVVSIVSFALSFLPWRWRLWRKIINLIFIMVTPAIALYRRVQKIDNKLHRLIFKILTLISSLFIILSLSIIMSILFFRGYLPQDAIKYPVDFSYQKCDSSALTCSYPRFSIKLEFLEQLFTLSPGQKYNFYLDLTIPDSALHQDAGMFSVWSVLLSKYGNTVASTEKSVMLKYRSPLYSYLSTLLLFPFIHLGYYNEEQSLTKTIFEDYLHVNDNYMFNLEIVGYNFESRIVFWQHEGAHELRITLHTKHFNVYDAYLRIEANFTGLRYYMNFYPITTWLFLLAFLFFSLTILSLIVQFQCCKFKAALIASRSPGESNLPTPQIGSNEFTEIRRRLMGESDGQSIETNPPSS